ncbi:acylphosphatase [Microbacterium sp. NPDC091313]
MPRIHVVVQGVVQGVGFRWSLQREAVARGATGWARNLADGTVEAEIEAEDAALDALRAWLRSGPAGARVDTVVETRVPASAAAGFEIRRDG